MKTKELKEFLDAKVEKYSNPLFIESDPIQIPHKYTLKEDIEISAFLVATIAWGNRKSIISNAERIMHLMGNSPYDFVMTAEDKHWPQFDGFVHRTFNSQDLVYFLKSLKNIYSNHGGLESAISRNSTSDSTQNALSEFRKIFFELDHLPRTTKHLADPSKGSAAKRMNMFLRWMVRSPKTKVDFGLWKQIAPSALSCPLDVHSGNVARKLGLLKRKQNDARAVYELDQKLRLFDPLDPVKYDFALFGLGVFEKF